MSQSGQHQSWTQRQGRAPTPATHHIVSLVKDDDDPLQVDAVRLTTLERKGLVAGNGGWACHASHVVQGRAGQSRLDMVLLLVWELALVLKHMLPCGGGHADVLPATGTVLSFRASPWGPAGSCRA